MNEQKDRFPFSGSYSPVIERSEAKLIPVTKWEEYHPWPSESGLRYLIFNAQRNGFHICVRRIGRRVLIDELRFFEWVEQQNKQEDRS